MSMTGTCARPSDMVAPLSGRRRRLGEGHVPLADPPGHHLDPEAPGLDRRVLLGERARLRERSDAVEAHAAQRLVGLVVERSGDDHLASLTHALEVREVLLLDLLALGLG